jgi:CHAT domain-containing protein
MAGDNNLWTGGIPLEYLEDGILTAYVVSLIDLSVTELVVLSGCETGLGDIKGNEGVYGLQRAFRIAGAKNILMSLWQVPDFATQELMTLFYTNWIKEKMDLPEAFRKAQATMRAKRPNPVYWAGFVLVE